jgi:hypothetical protein
MRGLANIAIAAWVMTVMVMAVGYGLCLGAAEAVTAPGHQPIQRS